MTMGTTSQRLINRQRRAALLHGFIVGAFAVALIVLVVH